MIRFSTFDNPTFFRKMFFQVSVREIFRLRHQCNVPCPSSNPWSYILSSFTRQLNQKNQKRKRKKAATLTLPRSLAERSLAVVPSLHRPRSEVVGPSPLKVALLRDLPRGAGHDRHWQRHCRYFFEHFVNTNLELKECHLWLPSDVSVFFFL